MNPYEAPKALSPRTHSTTADIVIGLVLIFWPVWMIPMSVIPSRFQCHAWPFEGRGPRPDECVVVQHQ
jgi:hypothetical protein